MDSKKVEFVLEAKVAPNKWVEIAELYPQIDIASRYIRYEDAYQAKGKLKSALAGPWKSTYKKKPIRVSELPAQ